MNYEDASRFAHVWLFDGIFEKIVERNPGGIKLESASGVKEAFAVGRMVAVFNNDGSREIGYMDQQASIFTFVRRDDKSISPTEGFNQDQVLDNLRLFENRLGL
jgi:hypothetical protein